MKLKSVLLLILTTLIFACKNENKESSVEINKIENKNTEKTLQDIIDNEKIQVLEETKNDSLRKVVVNLELSEKISERELKKIAKKIRKYEDDENYDKIWIFFFLTNTKENSGAWATAHYSPELEIKILGATKDEEEKAKNKINTFKGEIIGKWYEEQYTNSSFVILKEDDKFIGKTIFKNGQEMSENLEIKELPLGTKYFDKDNSIGEYYVVLKNGELGFYNKENKQYTTGKIVK